MGPRSDLCLASISTVIADHIPILSPFWLLYTQPFAGIPKNSWITIVDTKVSTNGSKLTSLKSLTLSLSKALMNRSRPEAVSECVGVASTRSFFGDLLDEIDGVVQGRRP